MSKEMVQLLYIVASLHVLLCPFTKVEESYNIQATHDILYHRHNLSQYDHNEFPGVVPRTFVGPLIISTFSAPIVGFLHITGISKFWMQYVVRLTLALTVIGAWSRLRNALQRQFGNTYTWWYTLITVTQYHFMFYMSRPLPNIMALPLVLLAYEGWLSGRHKQFLASAGAAIIIFRSELAMLFGLFLIMDLYFKKIDLMRLFKIVIPIGIGLVAITVIVDSIFWGRPLWPEAEVFWFNTILNKSSNYGTSPFLWYFYSALPRGLGPSLVLIPVGMYLDKRLVPLAAPGLVYILLYSFLPHKELRFIIYVFPLLNMASAATCTHIYIRRTKAPIYELLFWGANIIILGNVILSLAFALVAMTNYPGGVAITRFHKVLKDEPFVNVHISNLAAQTGVTRFTQINSHWIYSKNESLTPEQLQVYTHLLIEGKSKYSPNLKYFTQTHSIIDSIESFSQVAMNYKLMPPVRIKTKPALFILERKDFREFPLGHSAQIIDSSQISVDREPANEGTITNYESLVDVVDYESNESELIDSVVISTEKIENTLDNKEANGEAATVKIQLEETVLTEEEEIIVNVENDEPGPKLNIAKKNLDEYKTLRKERKKKAIEKIKSETRKEVVASAKEKLKEIMKRHKHIADELSESIRTDEKVIMKEVDGIIIVKEVDGRGDIPGDIIINEPESIDDEVETDPQDIPESISPIVDNTNRTNENIDSIVEEVIARLIDRKIYNDKTKPEDIKAEDRHMIQKIVEEILAERMNYTNTDK